MEANKLTLGTILKGHWPLITAGFLLLMNGFLLKAYIRDFSFITVASNFILVALGILLLAHNGRHLFSTLSKTGKSLESESRNVAIMRPSTINWLVQEIEAKVEGLQEYIGNCSSLPNIFLGCLCLDFVTSLISPYFIIMIALNTYSITQLSGRRLDKKFDYTISDLITFGKDMGIGIWNRIPKWTSED